MMWTFTVPPSRDRCVVLPVESRGVAFPCGCYVVIVVVLSSNSCIELLLYCAAFHCCTIQPVALTDDVQFFIKSMMIKPYPRKIHVSFHVNFFAVRVQVRYEREHTLLGSCRTRFRLPFLYYYYAAPGRLHLCELHVCRIWFEHTLARLLLSRPRARVQPQDVWAFDTVKL